MTQTTFADGCTGAASNSRYATIPRISQQFQTSHDHEVFIGKMKAGFLMWSAKTIAQNSNKRSYKDGSQNGTRTGDASKESQAAEIDIQHILTIVDTAIAELMI